MEEPMPVNEMMPSSSFLRDHSFHEEDREEIMMRRRMQEILEKKQQQWRMEDEPGPSQPKRMCASRGSSERGEGRSAREGTDDSEFRRVRYVGDTSVASNIVEEVRNAKAVVDKYFSKVTEYPIINYLKSFNLLSTVKLLSRSCFWSISIRIKS